MYQPQVASLTNKIIMQDSVVNERQNRYLNKEVKIKAVKLTVNRWIFIDFYDCV